MRTHRPQRAAGLSPRGFTLIEMMVVVAIVLVLLGLVLPAASTLWNDRKRAGAVNMIQGLLMTTRAKAMQAGGAERGFLAFVDDQGVQHLVPIEQPLDHLPDLVWQDVFEIAEGPDHLLPAPMRVVPRYVVEDPAADPDGWNTFSEEELGNRDFDSLPAGGNQAQRHRNYFAMVFSTDGQLLVNRDVLIIQDEDADGNRVGDRTGLPVGPGPPDPPTTTEYYSETDVKTEIDPTGAATPIPFLVVDDGSTDVAINFRSVDGLLVYDDSLFNDVPAAEKRSFLLGTARPLYVSRYTGMVIRGPVGENVAP